LAFIIITKNTGAKYKFYKAVYSLDWRLRKRKPPLFFRPLEPKYLVKKRKPQSPFGLANLFLTQAGSWPFCSFDFSMPGWLKKNRCLWFCRGYKKKTGIKPVISKKIIVLVAVEVAGLCGYWEPCSVLHPRASCRFLEVVCKNLRWPVRRLHRTRHWR
jgi:hypothetical protein